jgi:SRSO17 transposase
MRKYQRMPQAPSEPPPQLAEFLAHFHVHFAQQRSRATLARYLSGLLTEHPNKNCDTLAAVIQGTNEQQLHHLLTEMVWDEADLNRQRVTVMRGLRTERDGVLIIADRGFAKQGRHSVGVARQYSGTLGKGGNCQVTVNCHYAERTLAWPVATRLYLPQTWTEDVVRRKAAHIPEELPFQPKAELALALIDEANQCGVRHACVVADADYGDNPHFLNGLDARGERYCAAVRADFRVRLTRTAGEKSHRVDTVLATLPARHWQAVTWRQGSTGPLRGKFVVLRCWRVDGDGTVHIGWLIGQRPGRGQTGDRKYYWSNFAAHTPLAVMVEYAHRRSWVEQYHEEAKELLGWDQYQGRLWAGFHRHAVTVMLAYSFLVWLEWHERSYTRRPGPPRGVFSPAPRSPAPLVARAPAQHCRLATGGGHRGAIHHQSHCSLPSYADLTK